MIRLHNEIRLYGVEYPITTFSLATEDREYALDVAVQSVFHGEAVVYDEVDDGFQDEVKALIIEIEQDLYDHWAKD